MGEGLQRRIEAALQTLQRTGSKAAAAGAFVYPSSMSWTGRSGGILSMAPRNHPWRNIDPLDNSAVMACLGWVTRNFGQADLRTVREKRDGTDAPVDVPGFLDLIYRPNDFYSMYTLWAATLLSYHLNGNAYWIKVRNARGFGVPSELWYEPHWSIKPHWPTDGSQFIDYYERTVNGQTQKIPVENIVHFRNGLNPGNTRYGLAPLMVALLEVFTDQEAAAFTASLLKNMAIPGVVINPTTPLGLTPEKAEAIKQKFQAKFGGDNRGEPLLLDFEATVTTLGFSPNDMDLTSVRRIGEERISACFGIPAIVAGLGAGLESSTYNNLFNLKKSAFEENLVPAWSCFGEELTRQLLPDFTQDETIEAEFDTSMVKGLKEDQDQKNDRIVNLVKTGILTIAQAQTELGYPPDSQANYYLLPTNARPATAATAMARAAQEITDPATQPFDQGTGNGPNDQGGAKLLPDLKKKAYEWGGMMLGRAPTELEQLIDIKGIDDAMEAGEASITSALLAMRERYIAEAIDELDGLDSGDYHSLVVNPTDQDRSQIRRLLEQVFLTGAALIVNELNRQGAELLTPAVSAPDTEALDVVAGVTVSRVANDVQARVTGAAQQAEMLGVDVIDMVRQSMADGSTVYVERAARSAVNAALSEGRDAEIKAHPNDISFLVYSAVLDANTCGPCGDADGETGQLDEIPPVPNPDCPGGAECRCVHIAVRDISK